MCDPIYVRICILYESERTKVVVVGVYCVRTWNRARSHLHHAVWSTFIVLIFILSHDVRICL